MSDEILRNINDSKDDGTDIELVEVYDIPEYLDSEEATPLETEEELEPFPIDLEDSHCIRWAEANLKSMAPQLLIDPDLKVRWRNIAYRRFRETPGLSYNYKDRTFDDFFTTFAEGTAASKILRTQFISALQNPDTGFSWQGSVYGLGPNLRKFLARLTVTPQSLDETGNPKLYRAQLDDFTTDYEEILQNSYEGILQASMLKDEDTGNHIKRVNFYSRFLARGLYDEKIKGNVRWIDIDENFIGDIGNLAAFHDVGKIGTPEHILLKPGKLNDEEWAVMKEHPINGALVLSSHPKPMAREIARTHHERWDGTGYPSSCDERFPRTAERGRDSPFGAYRGTGGRLRRAADQAPYKETFSEEKTASIIIEGSGSHFDPGIVEVFKLHRNEFDRIFRELPD